MDLNFWLSTASLVVLVYLIYTWWLERRAALQPAESVKNKPRVRRFKLRSRRSERSNAANAGSAHQGAVQPVVNVQRVQPVPASPAGAVGDAVPGEDGFTLTPRELAQMAEALRLRQEGLTVEECLSRAFGVRKGGSEGYKRAKSLFDAATALPGAAPAGTYGAPAPARRTVRRRAPQR